MSSGSYPTEHLSDARMVGLLNIGLTSGEQLADDPDQLWRWFEIPSGQLVKEFNKAIKGHKLEERDVAQLLGVNQLTVRRWFSGSKLFPDQVKERLAGLCYLLRLALHPRCPVEVKELVDEAIAAIAKSANDPSRAEIAVQKTPQAGVQSVFGVPGLMAAALYLSLYVRNVDDDSADPQDP